MEAEATKTLETVVRELPCGSAACMYESEPLMNKRVATTIPVAVIPNWIDHGAMDESIKLSKLVNVKDMSPV